MKQLNEIKLEDLKPSKSILEILSNELHQQVLDGNIDPIGIAVKMNAMEQLVKLTKEKIMNQVLDELMKYPKGKAELHGASVSTVDSVKYDFSHIPEWQELENEITSLKEKQKQIEDHEKTYFKGNLPIKSASSTFKVQLPK